MGRKLGFGVGGSQSPSGHDPLGHGTTHPQETSKEDVQPPGMSWIHSGGSTGPQDPPPALPAAPPKCCLDWAPAGCLQRRHGPAPGEGSPPPRPLLAHQSPFKGRCSPQSVLM